MRETFCNRIVLGVINQYAKGGMMLITAALCKFTMLLLGDPPKQDFLEISRKTVLEAVIVKILKIYFRFQKCSPN